MTKENALDKSSEGAAYQCVLLYKQAEGSSESAAKYRDALLAAFDAFSAGDNKPFWALFDPELVFHVTPCLPYGGAHHGLDATRKALQAAHECYDQARLDVEQLLFGGDLALAYFQFNFRVRKTGRTASVPMSEMYRFRGGKIIEWRAFHFNATLMAEMLAADH